jgi:Family of unknown function (DUF6262)
VVSIERRAARFAESTIAALQAVVSARTDTIARTAEASRMRGNPGNLRKAAASKSAAARARAEAGLQQMTRRGDQITFRGLAQAAGVSLDFLYRTPDIRRRVEQLRAQPQATPPTPAVPAGADQPSSVVRTFTAQLSEPKRRHRDQVNALKQALEAAHGHNLELRRRLGHSEADAAG